MSTPIKFNSKAALLAALEARRPWAKKLDAAAVAKHKRDEQEALKAWKQGLRAALKQCQTAVRERLAMDYETAKENPWRQHWRNNEPMIGRGTSWRDAPELSRPSCPRPTLQKLETSIAQVTASEQERYSIRAHGHYDDLHYLLTYDENAKPDVCS